MEVPWQLPPDQEGWALGDGAELSLAVAQNVDEGFQPPPAPLDHVDEGCCASHLEAPAADEQGQLLLAPAWQLIPPPHTAAAAAHDPTGLPAADGGMAAPGGKRRLRWTPELHKLFLSAVNALGGAERATPKQIMLHMSVEGLSLFHVKSHLQKFRLATKGVSAKGARGGSRAGGRKKAAVRGQSDSSSEDDDGSTERMQSLTSLECRVQQARSSLDGAWSHGGPSTGASGLPAGILQEAQQAAQEQSGRDDSLESSAWWGAPQLAEGPAASEVAAGGGSSSSRLHLHRLESTARGSQQPAGASSQQLGAPAGTSPQGLGPLAEDTPVELAPAAAAAAGAAAAAAAAPAGEAERCRRMEQALSMQMDLQRQLQEALEAQRQLQCKLLAHGEFIQRLICGTHEGSGAGAKAGGSRKASKATGANGQAKGKRRAPSSQAAASAGAKRARASPQPQRSAAVGPSRVGRPPSAPRLAAALQPGSGLTSAALLPEGDEATYSSQVLVPQDAMPTALQEPQLQQQQQWGVCHPAQQGVQEQEQQQQQAFFFPEQQAPAAGEDWLAADPSAFQVDSVSVLARLAHNMPVHEQELATLLSPASHLSQQQGADPPPCEPPRLLRLLLQRDHLQQLASRQVQQPAQQLQFAEPSAASSMAAASCLGGACSFVSEQTAAMQLQCSTHNGTASGPAVASPSVASARLASSPAPAPKAGVPGGWVVSQRKGGMLCTLGSASEAQPVGPAAAAEAMQQQEQQQLGMDGDLLALLDDSSMFDSLMVGDFL